jgi:hypothetical protein
MVVAPQPTYAVPEFPDLARGDRDSWRVRSKMFDQVPEGAQGAQSWWKAVSRDDVRARAMAAGLAQDGKPPAVSMRFSRALEALCAQRKVRMEGDLIWLI